MDVGVEYHEIQKASSQTASIPATEGWRQLLSSRQYRLVHCPDAVSRGWWQSQAVPTCCKAELATSPVQQLAVQSMVRSDFILKKTSWCPLPFCRPALAVTAVVATAVNLSGNVNTEYTPALMRTLGASADGALLMGVGTAVCYTAAALLAARAMDRAGRKPMLYLGGCVMVFAQVSRVPRPATCFACGLG
jgi:hypothetical protein